ncbi:MAG: DUF2970 domain-containing protein [Burkholderiaceae bacterium]|nr:DUF2970 domain-containing protein [Burkholderiaceae bacterium]
MTGSAGGDAIPRDGRGDGGHGPEGRRSFADALRAVAWAFFGIRKRRSFDRDVHLNPVHVILVGLLLAAVFVGSLVMIARFAAG